MVLLALAQLAATAAAPPPGGLHRTTLMAVRVQVIQSCVLAKGAASCRLATDRPAPVRLTADGRTTVYEF
jgi:hypothetical protein